MAYVITDSCIKDSLCVDVCPPTAFIPSRMSPVSKRRLSSSSTRSNVSTAVRAFPPAPQIRFSPSTTFPRIKSRSSSATPPSSRTEPAFLLCAQNRRRSWNRIVESMPRPAPSFHLHVAPNPFTTEPQRKPFFFCFLFVSGFSPCLRASVVKAPSKRSED